MAHPWPPITPAQQILADEDAYLNWEFPDGPWGWTEDGTSKAPNPTSREAHLMWYHDMREGWIEHPAFVELRTALDALFAECPLPIHVVQSLVHEITDAAYAEKEAP